VTPPGAQVESEPRRGERACYRWPVAGTRRILKLLVAAVLCGCANDPVGIATTRSGTPRPDASAAEAGSDAGGERRLGRDASAPLVGEDSGAQRPDATSATESDAGGSAEAALRGPDSGGALTDVFVLTRDAGETPPEHCVAPCIWELIVDCLPTLDECTVEGDSWVCDARTGWMVNESYGSRVGGFRVYGGASECFDATAIWPLGVHQYDGPRGPVGFGDEDEVVCSAFSRWNPSTPQFPPDAVVYELTPDAPECAAWGRHGFPVGALSCASETEGECPESQP